MGQVFSLKDCCDQGDREADQRLFKGKSLYNCIIIMIYSKEMEVLFRFYLKRTLEISRSGRVANAQGTQVINGNRVNNVLKTRFSSFGKRDPYVVLGIETSCDETAASVVTSSGQILSNVVLTNPQTHEKFGGVNPAAAARGNCNVWPLLTTNADHRIHLPAIINAAMKEASLDFNRSQLSAIAVAAGPGLGGSLRVGVQAAKELALEYNIPLIPVHHLEGHALVVRMLNNSIQQHNPLNQFPVNEKEVNFPFLLILVSGGHTQLLLCRGIGDYLQLGGTLDDSLGEAYDKVARLLGIPFAEGRHIYNI